MSMGLIALTGAAGTWHLHVVEPWCARVVVLLHMGLHELRGIGVNLHGAKDTSMESVSTSLRDTIPSWFTSSCQHHCVTRLPAHCTLTLSNTRWGSYALSHSLRVMT